MFIDGHYLRHSNNILLCCGEALDDALKYPERYVKTHEQNLSIQKYVAIAFLVCIPFLYLFIVSHVLLIEHVRVLWV